MSADQFSLSEFSEFLDDSDGHRLAQFLQKKSGAVRQGGRRIFSSEPERFSLNVRLKRVSTPSAQLKNVSKEPVLEQNDCDKRPSINSQANGRDIHPIQEKDDKVDLPTNGKNKLESSGLDSACGLHAKSNVSHYVMDNVIEKLEQQSVPLKKAADTQEMQQFPIIASVLKDKSERQQHQSDPCTSEQVQLPSSPHSLHCAEERRCENLLAPVALPSTPRSIRLKSTRSPISKALRSGGINSADRLRRQVLNRRSVLGNNGKRTLIKEFDSTISSTDFAPKGCSTPMSHRQSNSPKRPQNEIEDLPLPSLSLLNNQEIEQQALIQSMVEQALEETINKLNSITNANKKNQSNAQETNTCKKSVDNEENQVVTPPKAVKNANALPLTQDLLQEAQAQNASNNQVDESRAPITQDLLQQVQTALKEIKKLQTQAPNIVIPVNQTFNNAPCPTANQNESILNTTTGEKTLTNSVVRDNNCIQLHDTITQFRSSQIHPNAGSLCEPRLQNASNCEKTRTFVNHPTFTHNNETIDNLLRKQNISQTTQDRSHNNKIVETYVEQTQRHHDSAVSHHNLEQNSTRHNRTNTCERNETPTINAQHEHSVVQDPASSLMKNASITNHSRIFQRQSTKKQNTTHTSQVSETCKQQTQVECHRLEHSIAEVPDISIKTKELNKLSAHSIVQKSNIANDAIGNEKLSNVKSPVFTRRSILKNRNLPAESPTNNIAKNENGETANSSLITEDESTNISHIAIEKNRGIRKSGPLNLAPDRHKRVLRSKRKRKYTIHKADTVISPLLTSDSDADTAGPPPAHPLNLRHTRRVEYKILQEKSKRPLNKPPSTPKNGEKFAEELKAHLARLTNHEILDLRKRNSIGESLTVPKHFRKSGINIQRALKQKLEIEQQIQNEILRRELLGEAEGLEEITAHNEEPLNDSLPRNANSVVDDSEIVNEFDNLLSAPDAFRDSNKSRTDKTPEEILLNVTAKPSHPSSLIDDTSSERVTFIQPNNITTPTVQGRRSRSRKKKSEELPEITKRYIQIQNKVRKRRQPNTSKRSLYSKGDSTAEIEETQHNIPLSTTSIEAIPPPPAFSATATIDNFHIPSPPPPLTLSPMPKKGRGVPSPVSSRKSRRHTPRGRKSSLLPPPPLFSTTSSSRKAAKSKLPSPSPPSPSLSPSSSSSMNLSPPAQFLDSYNNKTSNNANTTIQIARQTDNEIFKKPTMPAPKKRKPVTVDEASEGLRRSKRGQVPRRQNFLCGPQNGPPLIYTLLQAAERRSTQNKLKRFNKNSTSGSSDNDLLVPVASSTAIKTKTKFKRSYRRKKIENGEHVMFSYLGDTNTTTGTISSTNGMTSDTVDKRLQPIEETATESESEEVATKNNSRGKPKTNNGEDKSIKTKNKVKVSTQVEDVVTAKKTRDSKLKPNKAANKNPRQKRKVKDTNKQLPLEQNTTKTTNSTLTNVLTEVSANITDNQTSNYYITKSRLGVLELSRVNGPPPPPLQKLNEIFDQLKNAANHESDAQSEASSSATTTVSHRTRKLRVRVQRTNVGNSGATSDAITSPTTSRSSRCTQDGAENELYAWLKNITHSSGSTTNENFAIFKEMRASTAGNLHFTDLEGVDYAFYDTDEKSSVGYLRFKPLQHKPSKRAKKYNLHFVVLAGTFRIGTDNEQGRFGVGDMVAINIGKRYNITNMENDISILMVIKK